MLSRTLSSLLTDVAAEGPEGLATPVSGVACSSVSVAPGDAFFCIPGFAHDGHDFAEDAVSRGAAVVVAKRPLPGVGAPQVIVGDTRAALAEASAAWFDRPSRSMDVVGITGTNGKTTTTFLLDAILRAAGRRTGLIGTVGTWVAGERSVSARTTPESRDLQELLARMRDAGCDAVSMEVSSHALDLHRVDATDFAVAAFTNLTQDHLDFHRTLEEYASVKARLFTDLPVGARVLDVDDPFGCVLAARVEGAVTVGRSEAASVRADDLALTADSSRFRLITPAGHVDVALPLAGDFNVSNALVAAGCALALGIGPDVIAEGLAAAPQVPGRMERVDEGQAFSVLVDYAHTPDGLVKALAAVREVTPGRVITVFGCGGDRDPAKRALMGAAAARLADVAVLTTDNPRSEDPVGIVLQIEDGMRGSTVQRVVELDRREAIAAALAMARAGDTVLLAGKGHEDYQIFADRTVHFDDREVAGEELRRLCGREGAPAGAGAVGGGA